MQDSLPEIAAPVKKHKPLWEKLQPPLSESLRALLLILQYLLQPCNPVFAPYLCPCQKPDVEMHSVLAGTFLFPLRIRRR